MKAQIDNLVREIHDALAKPSLPEGELATLIYAIHADGPPKAMELLAVLDGWAEDMTLPPDMRAYARQQRATLPELF